MHQTSTRGDRRRAMREIHLKAWPPMHQPTHSSGQNRHMRRRMARLLRSHNVTTPAYTSLAHVIPWWLKPKEPLKETE